MKLKKSLIILGALVGSLSLTGCNALLDQIISALSITETGQTTYENKSVTIDPEAGDYYNTTDLSLEGAKLQLALHKLCLDRHTTYVRYSQFTSYTKASTNPRSIDQDPSNGSNNVLFYTGKSVSKSLSYTREHVWPCANSSNMWVHTSGSDNYVDSSTYIGGGSDLFHVRPCDSTVNSARGNAKYCDFTDDQMKEAVTCSQSGGKYTMYLLGVDSNGEFANKCQPANEYKGDIVRILMYVWIHYGKFGSYNNQYCGSLDISNVMDYKGDALYQKMVEWNALDPVSPEEKLRNNTIQAIQGNRNPFVDCPELIGKCFSL